jgi:hypothetical protein
MNLFWTISNQITIMVRSFQRGINGKDNNYRLPCHIFYRVFRAQADWTFILPSELPAKELRHLPRKIPPQAYQTSQYVVPRGGIFLGKWRSFVGSSDGNMNVQSACPLNTLY